MTLRSTSPASPQQKTHLRKLPADGRPTSKVQRRDCSLWVAPCFPGCGTCSEKAGGSRGRNRRQSAPGIILSGPLLGCVLLISAVLGSAGPGVPAQHAWREPQLPTGDRATTSSNLKLTTHGDLRPVDQKAELLSGGWEWGVVIDHHQEVGAPLQRGQGA